jgi:peptide/nickel transport system substrate-binding protein
MKRRDFLKAASASAVGLGLWPSYLRTSAAKERTSTLKFVPQADLAVLDPGGTPAYVTRNHALMVYDTLFGVDDKFAPHPQMVDTSIVEDDGKLWRMTLRPGLLFHDNTPVTANDVVASIKRWGGLDRVGKVMMQSVADIVAVDAKTVEFRLSKPFPMLADALGKVASYSPVIMPERHAVLPPTSPLPEIIGSGP